MTSGQQPAARGSALDFLMHAAPFVVLGLVALLPRLLDLGLFLDSDEVSFWMGRSQVFLDALKSGRFADTAISTHPGVTTMWLGSAGIVLRRTLLSLGLLESSPFPVVLAYMRLPPVLVHTAIVLAGYALLRRMFPLRIALLAALLWAADPFLIAYQRILHVDGLTASFAILSVLAACCYWQHTRQPALLVLSACAAGLAVLSKSPALAVLPVILALSASRQPPADSAPAASPFPFAGLLLPLLAWGAVFVATIVLAWPAIWADPLRVYEYMRVGVEVEGGSPHVIGNFFLGREDNTPGPLFYPAAVALRTTPFTLAGLLLLPWVWTRSREMFRTRQTLALLALLALLFVLGLSLFPKKLNRYIVPAFPALDILAAAGLVWGIEWLARIGKQTRLMANGLLTAIAVLAVVNAAGWHPYYTVAFNQALGGASRGERTFLLGDGEGLNEVADWLNQQPDITGVRVLSTMINSFQPYLRPGAQSVSPEGTKLPDHVGYVVIYIRHVQRGGTWPGPPYDQFYHQATPLHTVTLHGIEYAWIYQVPPPIEHHVAAHFGPNIALNGYALDSAALHTTGALSLTLQWQAAAPVEQDYMLFLHVLDSNGQRVGQIDVPPAGPAAPARTWQPGRYQTWTHPLPVQADLPPGNYWLALGLYQPDTFARLPLQGAAPAGAPDAGDNALLLPLTLP